MRFDARPVVALYPSVDAAAAALGVEPRTVFRYLADGLTWEQADRVAITAGYHPSFFWGDEWRTASLADTPADYDDFVAKGYDETGQQHLELEGA